MIFRNKVVCQLLAAGVGMALLGMGCSGTSSTVPTPAAVPTNTSAAPHVTLDNLVNGQMVPCEVMVQGSYSKDVTEPIWLVIPQNNIWFPADLNFQPAAKINGRWSQAIWFGDCNEPERDKGLYLQLLVLRASEACAQQLDEFFEEALRTGDFSGIPDYEVSQSCKESISYAITVTRE